MPETLVVHGLSCRVAGHGPPVLLLHAGVADMDMWEDLIPGLGERHRAIRYDLRGWGRSEVTAVPYSHHEDAAAVLDALEVQSAHVVGASFGASVAIDLALAHPGRVRSLVLAAPVVSGWEPSSDEVLSFFAAEEAALERGDIDGATELNLRMWVDGPTRPPSPARTSIRERVRIMQKRAFSLVRPPGAVERPLHPPAWGRLGEIRVPALVVSGDRDVPELGTVADHLAGIPGFRKTILGGAGHLPSLEAPEIFGRLLLEFLDGQRA